MIVANPQDAGFILFQETPGEGPCCTVYYGYLTPEPGDEWIPGAPACPAYRQAGGRQEAEACPMQTRSLNHSTYKLQYHLVWGTKYRRKWLKSYVKAALKKVLYETCKKYPTLFIRAVNTDEDHVHIQMEIPPSIAIADAVQKLKGTSSSALRKQFKFIREMYLEKDGIWSVGYFVSSIGLNETTIKRYIEWQDKKEQHPQTTKLF